MSLFLQLTITNLTVASVYVLLGQGWNLVYSGARVLHLAIGEFYVLGALLSYKLSEDLGLSPLAAGGCSLLLAALLAFIVERTVVQRVGTNFVGQVLALIGVALVMREAFKEVFGINPLRPQPLLTGPPIQVADLAITRQSLLVIAAASAVSIALWLVFHHTDVGRTMRAVADNAEGAWDLGIDVGRYRMGAFVAASVLAALAGLLIGPIVPLGFHGGAFIAMKGFLVIAIGGIGSFRGAVVGAVLVASIEGYMTGYWTAQYRDLIVFAFLIVMLLARTWSSGGVRARIPRLRSPRAGAPAGAA